MPHQNQNKDARQATGRRKRVWLIPIAVGFLAIVAGVLWIAGFGRDSRSADEHLAEIEAARAIPDAENAAMIYDYLFQDPKATSLSNACSRTGEPLLSYRVLYWPWLSKDQPEVDAWIKEHQYIIDRLLAAARFEKCRSPISIDIADTAQIGRGGVMRQWGFLLSSAANNDIAEGRVDAALAKWRCLIQMGNHLHQQPLLTNQLVGMAVEKLALEAMARFVVVGDVAESRLREIEALPLPMRDCGAEYDRETRLVDALMARKVVEQIGLRDSLRHPIQTFQVKREIKSIIDDQSRFDTGGELYRRGVATARGIRILVALRRYKNATGRWPASLDDIRTSLPDGILIDPFNGGAFVYRLAADTFRLYSRGKNNVDENGDWQSEGADDWPIWPPRRGNPAREQENAEGG